MALEVNQGGGGGRAGSLTENDEYALDKPYDLYGEMSADKLSQIDEMFARLFQAVKRTKTAISASGSGDVVGPSSAVSGDVALFSGTTGKLLSDSGKLGSDLVTGPASAVDGNVVLYNGVTGKLVKDGGFPYTSEVTINGTLPLRVATIDLTQAQIQAFSSSGGYTIVNAPVDGRTLWSVFRWWMDKKISTVYSLNLTLSLVYSDGTSCGMNTITSGFTSTTRTIVTAAMSAGGTVDVRGLGIKVQGNGNPTGGNAGDAVRIVVIYMPVYMLS